MADVKVKIDAGICGFKTYVSASDDGMGETVLKIESECPSYQNLSAELEDVDAMSVCFAPLGKNEVFEACAKNCKHGACPVPTGIIKAMEAAAGFALPKNVSIEFEK